MWNLEESIGEILLQKELKDRGSREGRLAEEDFPRKSGYCTNTSNLAREGVGSPKPQDGTPGELVVDPSGRATISRGLERQLLQRTSQTVLRDSA